MLPALCLQSTLSPGPPPPSGAFFLSPSSPSPAEAFHTPFLIAVATWFSSLPSEYKPPFFFFFFLCIYFWLRWVFLAAGSLSLVEASGTVLQLCCTGFSLGRCLLLMQSAGFRARGLRSRGMWA